MRASDSKLTKESENDKNSTNTSDIQRDASQTMTKENSISIPTTLASEPRKIDSKEKAQNPNRIVIIYANSNAGFASRDDSSEEVFPDETDDRPQIKPKQEKTKHKKHKNLPGLEKEQKTKENAKKNRDCKNKATPQHIIKLPTIYPQQTGQESINDQQHENYYNWWPDLSLQSSLYFGGSVTCTVFVLISIYKGVFGQENHKPNYLRIFLIASLGSTIYVIGHFMFMVMKNPSVSVSIPKTYAPQKCQQKIPANLKMTNIIRRLCSSTISLSRNLANNAVDNSNQKSQQDNLEQERDDKPIQKVKKIWHNLVKPKNKKTKKNMDNAHMNNCCLQRNRFQQNEQMRCNKMRDSSASSDDGLLHDVLTIPPHRLCNRRTRRGPRNHEMRYDVDETIIVDWYRGPDAGDTNNMRHGWTEGMPGIFHIGRLEIVWSP